MADCARLSVGSSNAFRLLVAKSSRAKIRKSKRHAAESSMPILRKRSIADHLFPSSSGLLLDLCNRMMAYRAISFKYLQNSGVSLDVNVTYYRRFQSSTVQTNCRRTRSREGRARRTSIFMLETWLKLSVRPTKGRIRFGPNSSTYCAKDTTLADITRGTKTHDESARHTSVNCSPSTVVKCLRQYLSSYLNLKC